MGGSEVLVLLQAAPAAVHSTLVREGEQFPRNACCPLVVLHGHSRPPARPPARSLAQLKKETNTN